MNKKIGIASILAGAAATAILSGRGTKAAAAAPPRTTPAPSNLPAPRGTSPTEQPRPRAPSAEFSFKSLHRYEITADVLPVEDVGLLGLRDVAGKLLAHLRFDDADVQNYKTVQRAGVGEVTRVTFRANSLLNNPIAFERQYSIAGVGSVWLVAAKEIPQ